MILTYQAVAVHDAVMAIDGSHRPFAVAVNARAGASREAAVAAAAHRVLADFLPAQTATILDPAYSESLDTIPDGRAKSRGVVVGRRVARQLIKQRAGDGFREPATHTPPDPPGPGEWIPTAPTPPVGPFLAEMQPFSLDRADQFRPAGPPELTSEQWVADYREVEEIGSAASTTRTEEQTLAARFWAEPPATQEHASLRALIAERRLDVVEAARLAAIVAVTGTDAEIVCFDAKYHYTSWRPITAIRAGDTDGNGGTHPDPSWSPLLPTPNHPEYPAAHLCNTAAVGRAIAGFLGTERIELTMVSVSGLGDRRFTTVDELIDEVANARIWGGMHFRSAVEDGTTIGAQVADHVLGELQCR